MRHPVDVQVGRRIRHFRWMAEKTQQDLAAAVGIKFQQIQKYETGANRVSASRLYDIAVSLGVPVARFFDTADEVSNDAELRTEQSGDAKDIQPAERMADRETLEFLRSYYRLSVEPRKRLLALTRSLADATAHHPESIEDAQSSESEPRRAVKSLVG